MEPTSDAVPQRLIAALEGKYRVDREIGAGGSATVFLAEDLKHHRRVAIKVLNPQVAAALGPERFEDEVRIAAGLHHPHILTVHDSGEADGLLYYVMPFVDGQSLRERMAEGRLPFPKVAKILAEVADALAYAHAQGIVHRDIKPENILYNGKHVVVTDFGIAKAISDAAERKSSTSMGIALGTPAYMAPEQASSDPSLDHRADLYSLGIVGYEMLVGHPPFSGTAQQILTSHLTTKPEPVGNLREDVPPALAAVVMRALAKSPGDRWANAEAMQAQLETLTGTTSNSGLMATVVMAASRRAPSRAVLVGIIGAAVVSAVVVVAWKRMQPAAAPPAVTTAASPGASGAIADIASDPSIAVLPFDNMSSDKEQVYFSDGISEELLNLLSKIPELRVTARTSSFQFRGQEIGIQEIARKLNVASVLQGSVRKSGDKVRITAQLIRAKDGVQLWSETYDRTLDDIFRVQDEIAANVVDKLKLTLLGGGPKSQEMDPKLYPLLLQADALNSQGSPTNMKRAVELYQQIVEQQPGVARAWAGMSRSYLNLNVFSPLRSRELEEKSRQAAEKALALDPNLAIAYTYLGRLALQDSDRAKAASYYQRAIEIAPTSNPVLSNVATLLTDLGRLEEAARIRRHIARVDPANPTSHANLCSIESVAAHLEQALEACRTALAMAPDYAFLHSVTAQLLLRLGRHEEARAEAVKEPDPGTRDVVLAEVEFASGNRAASDAALKRALAAKPQYLFGIAEVYAYRNEPDRAFEWMERALAEGDPEITSIQNAANFAPIHGDPRWARFLARLGVAPEQLAKIRLEIKVAG